MPSVLKRRAPRVVIKRFLLRQLFANTLSPTVHRTETEVREKKKNIRRQHAPTHAQRTATGREMKAIITRRDGTKKIGLRELTKRLGLGSCCRMRADAIKKNSLGVRAHTHTHNIGVNEKMRLQIEV